MKKHKRTILFVSVVVLFLVIIVMVRKRNQTDTRSDISFSLSSSTGRTSPPSSEATDKTADKRLRRPHGSTEGYSHGAVQSIPSPRKDMQTSHKPHTAAVDEAHDDCCGSTALRYKDFLNRLEDSMLNNKEHELYEAIRLWDEAMDDRGQDVPDEILEPLKNFLGNSGMEDLYRYRDEFGARIIAKEIQQLSSSLGTSITSSQAEELVPIINKYWKPFEGSVPDGSDGDREKIRRLKRQLAALPRNIAEEAGSFLDSEQVKLLEKHQKEAIKILYNDMGYLLPKK